jgi:hypothetical protein
VDQTDFLLGKSEKSNREGFPVFVADRLEAVKWRNWKVVFYDEERDWWTPPLKLGVPKAFDLIIDPKEEYPQTGLRNSWNAGPAIRIVAEFEQSLKKYPPIEPGTPDPYSPFGKTMMRIPGPGISVRCYSYETRVLVLKRRAAVLRLEQRH